MIIIHIQLVQLVPICHPAVARAQTAQLIASVRRKDWLSVRALKGTKGVNQNKEGRTCHAQVKHNYYTVATIINQYVNYTVEPLYEGTPEMRTSSSLNQDIMHSPSYT